MIPETTAITAATERLAGLPHVGLINDDFLAHDFGTAMFDLVTFVASLHHLDSAATLREGATLLRPAGALLVVGLVRPTFPWMPLDTIRWPKVGLAGWIRHERQPDVTVRLAEPTLTLSQTRAMVRGILPGATVRYGLYYRCLVERRKPR